MVVWPTLDPVAVGARLMAGKRRAPRVPLLAMAAPLLRLLGTGRAGDPGAPSPRVRTAKRRALRTVTHRVVTLGRRGDALGTQPLVVRVDSDPE